jgi:hypothetical protein
VRDFQLWWLLFVFFAATSILVVQHRYQRWRKARRLLPRLRSHEQVELARRIRLEGWRLGLMVIGVLAMSGAVVTVFWPGPAVVLEVLRLVAFLAVVGVVLLSLRRWRG